MKAAFGKSRVMPHGALTAIVSWGKRNSAALTYLGGTLALATLAFASIAAPPKPAAPSQADTLPAKLTYNRDIRPILAENCFSCHGPDSAARKAGLRLDRFADATADNGNGAAIIPGDPILSKAVQRILKPSGDPLQMPPMASHKTLSPEDKKKILLWIEQGAEYEPHWSYIPPKVPALPPVRNMAWVRNPIDRFVLARLEASGLTPAPEADRRTLIRRVALDLVGLPPTSAEIEQFLADKSPDAYEKMVDRYLARPQWGEHRARFWLDAARYGDTHGIHIDNYREIWSYRDWVIEAFNRNLPFDRFSIEQLAGDLLPNPTLDQKIATGFTRCNITTSEGGAIDEEFLVLYTRDRTETTAQVWLGATAGCAVCHDHKFDPLSQKEFYQLAAFFNNTTQPAMDGNVHNTPPVIPVPRKEERARFAAVQTEIAGAKQAVEARKAAAKPDFDRWFASADTAAVPASIPADGLQFHAPLSEGSGTQVTVSQNGKTVTLPISAEPAWVDGQTGEKAFQRKDGSVIETAEAGDIEKDQAFTCAAWVKLPANAGGALIARMDDKNDFRGWDMWVEGNKIATHIIHKWPDNALKVVTKEAVKPNEWHHVCFTYNGGAKPESVTLYIDGVAKAKDIPSNNLKDTVRTTVPLKIGQRHSTSGMDGTAIQDVRLYERALSAEEVRRLATGTRAAYLVSRGGKLADKEREELYTWWLSGADTEYQKRTTALATLEAEERAIRERGTIAHIAQERKEEPVAYVLYRGEYTQRRDKVSPRTPEVLPDMPQGFPKNRLGFARWLFLPEHPLTARVTVNRFWQEIFGTGLVATSGDFGITGELPTHPELLDWMARDFQRDWNIKRFYKLIVTSATYRQAAVITPEKRQRDPENRLLSRGPRFRMDAEMIRDYALAASGLLVPKIGGPSVRPYQPGGIWEAVTMPGSNTREYKRDSGENLYRRSMYTFWKRSAPPASLEIFNAPSREVCTVRRERTNTPLQALVTLNDEQFVEAARHLAQRALREGGKTQDARLDYITTRLIARPLGPKERAIVTQSLVGLWQHYQANPEDAKALIAVGDSKPDSSVSPTQLATYTMLVNELMNLDEMLNK